MTAGDDRAFDPDTLVVGARYRVDNRDDELRRTFRTDGTYLGVEDRTTEDGAPVRILRFEVRPRFGKPAVQEMDLSTVVTVTPR
jgi:hypothetical protein